MHICSFTLNSQPLTETYIRACVCIYVAMTEELQNLEEIGAELKTDLNYKLKILWTNAIGFIIFHCLFFYGLYLCLFVACWKTFLWVFVSGYIITLGTSVGAHRFYAHRSFKAHFPLRLLLVILHTMTGQQCLCIWVRDHRAHHKYVDTDADPYNAKRSPFFAHIGWLLMEKHPLAIAKAKTIDLSDIKADPLVMFQKKYYIPLYWMFGIAIPMAVPMYFWNETFVNSFFIAYILRYGLTLHTTFIVNSAGHLHGVRPYNKNITATNSNIVNLLTLGEGWHNYHHAFPSDYRISEVGFKYNSATCVIDLFKYIGLAYDLRSAPEEYIKKTLTKYGDGSRLHLY